MMCRYIFLAAKKPSWEDSWHKVCCPNTLNMKAILIVIAIFMLAVMDPILQPNSISFVEAKCEYFKES
uniref:Uncharacterized protein n=1 Tax=Romanomermis culicivorax TaxID=13658 RepID=A0A915IVW4_ROMCU